MRILFFYTYIPLARVDMSREEKNIPRETSSRVSAEQRPLSLVGAIFRYRNPDNLPAKKSKRHDQLFKAIASESRKRSSIYRSLNRPPGLRRSLKGQNMRYSKRRVFVAVMCHINPDSNDLSRENYSASYKV
ncbi:hypothetical protein TMatcc_005444 [Talaromyces marneffei ATCC 18224]